MKKKRRITVFAVLFALIYLPLAVIFELAKERR